MNEPTPTPGHPTDEQLFDLLAGTLSRRDLTQVSHHLGRCSACRAFVDAAHAGTPVADQIQERMPADAAVAMHAKLAAEFELRHGSAPAQRAGLDVDAGSRFSAGASRGWRRWAIPIVAFVVVAALAGISITQIHTESPTSSNSAQSQSPTSSSVDTSMDKTTTTTKSASPSARELSGADRGGAGGKAQATKSDPVIMSSGAISNMTGAPPGSTPETALPELDNAPEDASAIPPAPQFEATRICVLAFASSEHPLPDDRPITYVRQLALDLVIACG